MKLKQIVSALGDHARLPIAWPIAWKKGSYTQRIVKVRK